MRPDRTREVWKLLLVGLVVASCSKVDSAQDHLPTGDELELTFEWPTVDRYRVVSMGTGSPGGVYFPLGEGIASLPMSERTLIVAESTGGSVENSLSVHRGMMTWRTRPVGSSSTRVSTHPYFT